VLLLLCGNMPAQPAKPTRKEIKEIRNDRFFMV
jgi:hypothetical protein